MKKTALILMVLTVLTKVLGFIRDIILSYFYGASNISDAYLISLTIPLTIFTFIGTALATSYIPIYSSICKKKDIQSANKFTSNILNFNILLCSIIVILSLIFTEPIVRIFASGFKGHTLSLTITFTRITILAIYFMNGVFIFNSYLQLKDCFVVSALGSIPQNLLIIISIILSAQYNNVILAIGYVVAVISQLVYLLPFVHKKGFRYNFIIDLHDENLKKLFKLSVPIIVGVSVNQINVLIDKTIASQIAVGGISALNYANKLNLFIQGIFVLSISTAMYPMISKMAAEDNIDGMKKSVSEAINSISLLVIPATVGAMLFAEPVVKLLFGRGAFDPQAISMTSTGLFYYSIGMLGFGLREIISRAFYSLQDTKTPMLNAAIAMTMNIVLNLILSKFMGIGGLALATSISAIFCTVLLFISFRKKIGSFGMKNIVVSSIKILCASLIMGVLAKLSYDVLLKHIGANLSLIAAIVIGAVVYFVLIYFMGIKEVDSMIDAVKKKFRRSVGNE